MPNWTPSKNTNNLNADTAVSLPPKLGTSPTLPIDGAELVNVLKIYRFDFRNISRIFG